MSWTLALGLVGFGIPRVVDISWHGVLPALQSIHWPAVLVLAALWLLGLYVHSFVLTAAAPKLTHRRALTLNVTGSAISNVVPLGGAAGVELNRRMMQAWGIDSRSFTGYTFLTNLWDVGAKLLSPVVAVAALAVAGEVVVPQIRTASLIAGIAFVVLVVLATTLLASARSAVMVGQVVEKVARTALRAVRRDRQLNIADALLDIRRECAGIVARGWLRMSVGISGYVALQALLLGLCLHLTGAGVTWADVLAGFAVERLLTVVPLTPGGVGVADLGLVGALIALGGDPTGVTAAAVLYRVFIFAVEIPVGGGALGLWVLGRRMASRARRTAVRIPTEAHRIAHVTDVFLPRLGGIETHVDDLARHQRARGMSVDVLTPTRSGGDDPGWVRRMSAAKARRAVVDYDVVHVHVSMFSIYGLRVARAAMGAGVPTLITVHTMWAGAGGIIRLAALAALRRWPVAWSAVSDAAAETFQRSLGGIDVAVLPNAIDVADWRPSHDGTPLGEAGDGDRDPVTVVTVGRLMPRKRPLQLLSMFEQAKRLAPHADLRLVFVGDGPLRGRLERRLRRRGLTDSVRIAGRLERTEVLDQLRSADLYLSAAPKESFGIAALEARCAGLPVIAYRRSGVREFIRDRVDGILVQSDEEMGVAIAELVTNDLLRARIAKHNRRVAPGFDWSDVLDQTQALYRTAADRAIASADVPVAPVRLAAEVSG